MEANGREIVERIDNLLKKKNLKRTAVYEYAGIVNNAFSDWSKRKTIPNADKAIKIAEFLGVSVQWLITGEDPEGLTAEERQLLDDWHAIAPEGRKAVSMMIKAYVQQAEEKKNKSVAKG